eukprot:CAMPEP_0170568206 /NCGR_PEP_ID=MMETSP0211-20121228/81012_1 /TAXON_ID=311385 /ORGANISM="Pseudokeronopsis sp., Strain OXSARD2" /LENGTH=43 /DNA_ID= /DNA_START= /DNA_END= /DNA_ORIENTATION=
MGVVVRNSELFPEEMLDNEQCEKKLMKVNKDVMMKKREPNKDN